MTAPVPDTSTTPLSKDHALRIFRILDKMPYSGTIEQRLFDVKTVEDVIAVLEKMLEVWTDASKEHRQVERELTAHRHFIEDLQRVARVLTGQEEVLSE